MHVTDPQVVHSEDNDKEANDDYIQLGAGLWQINAVPFCSYYRSQFFLFVQLAFKEFSFF